MTVLTRWRNSLIALLVAVPVGVAGGYAVDAHQKGVHAEARAAYDAWEPAPAPPVPEQLEGLLDDLAEERVVVAHDVAGLIAPEPLQEARTALEAAAVPSYLVYVRDAQSRNQGYRERGVLRLMEDAVEAPAYLVVLTTRGQVVTRSVGLESQSISGEVGAGQPGKALVAVARHQAMDPPGKLMEIPEQEAYDYFGGRLGAVMAGALISGVVIAPVAFVADLLWRRRRPRAATSGKTRGRVLP